MVWPPVPVCLGLGVSPGWPSCAVRNGLERERSAAMIFAEAGNLILFLKKTSI